MLWNPIERSQSFPADGGAAAPAVEAGVDVLHRTRLARCCDELLRDGRYGRGRRWANADIESAVWHSICSIAILRYRYRLLGVCGKYASADGRARKSTQIHMINLILHAISSSVETTEHS